MWRTVSFVERVEVEFSGNVPNQAIILGDIDNDKGNELAVGNIDGELAIFKGRGHAPWRLCSNLGMITCVGVGDIFSRGKNNLYCLTAEGWFYVFDVKIDFQAAEGAESHDEDAGDNLKPLFKQHLPPNGKVMQAADVDGDGKLELAMGYSDRVIRLYKWSGPPTFDNETESKGSMVQIDKWQLAGQIGSITLNKDKDGKSELLASQPGGTYVRLLHDPLSHDIQDGISETVPNNLVYDPLVSTEIRNSSISTEIVGNIRKGPGPMKENETEVLYALCTLDGTLVLVESGRRILWSLQVDHQLFSLNKLDVTGNGKEEVVCCSWDGQTYIVNHGREAVRYQFEDNVAAFTAGYYAVNTTDNVPCFVYATFNNRIYIYYNIRLPRVESTNSIEVMDKREETHELLSKLNIQSPSNRQLQELYHWCLYGWKNKS
ncbi:KICSTOR complex protein ITFG2-like [Mercenaria mercenaria]|uniref:KICSTOR complex protein ITFG2-like n=1 Tax=Mercenaria mercenaria TaxID=6596 RepID=UPI00234FB54A|nr:KICSTOR complex protein ITFG2-like [Mercenaria mercenaria]